jgi:hypothetical protein
MAGITRSIQIQPNTRTATQVVWASDPPTSVLVVNTDLNNVVYLSESDAARVSDISTGNLVPLNPNGSIGLDGTRDFFAVTAATTPVTIAIFGGGLTTFLGLTQGGGNLAIPSIQSPGFDVADPLASPVPSWGILQSGLAYFFGLTLSGGTFIGPNYIINTNGIFFYNGTPGVNNLLASWIPNAASELDPFGNEALPGFATYSTAGPPYFGYWEYDGAFSVSVGTSQAVWTSTHTIYQISPILVGNLLQGVTILLGGFVQVGSWTRFPNGSLQNGWTGPGADINGVIYRLTVDNEIEINFDIINTAIQVNTTVCTFSAPFIPTVNQKFAVGGAAGSGIVWAQLNTNGTFVMTGTVAANHEIAGNCKYALGTLPP